jgi:uncharacterized membrane protein YhiD involved in acid resistance
MDRVTFQSLLDSLDMDNITQINLDLNIWVILIDLAVAFAIVMFIYFIYIKTFSGVLYSKNFNITLVMVSLVTTAAVIVISSNIVLALGMVGALSIIRFRMAIKDPKDVGFLFWAITNGIICGISAYSLAVISALFIGLVVYILSRKIRITEPYLLIIKGKNINIKDVDDILKNFKTTYKLRSRIMEKEKAEIIIEIKVKKDKISEILGDLQGFENINFAKMVSYEGDLEEG